MAISLSLYADGPGAVPARPRWCTSCKNGRFARVDAWLKDHNMRWSGLPDFRAIDDVLLNLITDGEAERFIADLRAMGNGITPTNRSLKGETR